MDIFTGRAHLGPILLPQGGWLALQAEQQFWEVQGMILALAFSPLVLCAALAAGGWIRETLQRFPAGPARTAHAAS